MDSIQVSIFLCYILCNQKNLYSTNALSCIYLFNYFMIILIIMSVSQGLQHRMSKLTNIVSETIRHFIYFTVY